MALFAAPRPLETSLNELEERGEALNLLDGTVKSSSIASRWTAPDFRTGRNFLGDTGGKESSSSRRRLMRKVII